MVYKRLANTLLRMDETKLRAMLLKDVNRGGMMKKTLLEVAHDVAKDLHAVDAIDAQTMHEFDASCLPPIKTYTPKQIKRIRLENEVSQAVFAAYINTSPSTIRQWEQGLKKPSGISLKVLNLIENHGLMYLAA